LTSKICLLLRQAPRAGEEQIFIKAVAKFTTKSFVAGKYNVSVGIRQALLRLDHPSFELEDAYQATLSKETWSQSSKSQTTSHVAGSVTARIGATLSGFLGFKAEGQAGKDNRESEEQKASAPYRIVSATPTGWQIGSELGDPRNADVTLPDGLEHCLKGEYLTGRNEEKGDGFKEKTGDYALCVLRPKSGGNDPSIVATLSSLSGSLRIAISSNDVGSDPRSSLSSRSQNRAHEEQLRQAFVEICLQRAKEASKDGARTEAMLSGEFYLSHYEIHAPKLPQKVSAGIRSKTRGNQDEASVSTKSEE
jgi:hypothetical protein